ncbi:DUF6624 domain-containing protein [Roseivirga sp.]|uniref:DUF6624 domain-containing protein n=1 Tax=Roseivirga sp. TaxID=1964215 RepID=UPI003B523198
MLLNNSLIQKSSLIAFLIASIFLSTNSCELNKEEPFYQNPEWASQLIIAYKTFNKDRNQRSADLVFNATEQMPKKNWENYFVCAIVYAESESVEKAFLSIDRAIEYGLRDVELLENMPEFSSLKSSPKWEQVISKVENRQNEYLSNIKNPALFKELQMLWAEDQKALSTYEYEVSKLDSTATLKDYDRLFEPVETRWQTNRRKLDSIVTIYGWPGNRLVGEDGAKIAWSIAQHHPNVFFKKKCLALIQKAMKEGDADPNHYAELNDRIARETWQKQTFGASMGELSPYPIKNVAEVNKRRIALGLYEPVEVYALYHGIDYSIPDSEEVDSLDQLAQTNYHNFEQLYFNGKADSAVVLLRKAIKAHGAITNDQLFSAALKLAQTRNTSYENLTVQILKVLIWREWKNRFDILKHPEFKTMLSGSKWSEIKNLLNESEQL